MIRCWIWTPTRRALFYAVRRVYATTIYHDKNGRETGCVNDKTLPQSKAENRAWSPYP